MGSVVIARRTWALVACVVTVVALAVAWRLNARKVAARPQAAITLELVGAEFSLRAGDGGWTLTETNGGASRDGRLVVLYRGAHLPLALRHFASSGPQAAVGDAELSAGGISVEVGVTLRVDEINNAVVLALEVKRATPPVEPDSLPELGVELFSRDPFASGVGSVAQWASVPAPFVLSGEAPWVGIASEGLRISAETAENGLRVRAATTRCALSIFIARDDATLITRLAQRGSSALGRVAGSVRGVSGAARVTGQDDQGAPRVRFTTAADGRFAATVPASIHRWYAAPLASATVTSSPKPFTPGSGYDLLLDVSPGGELDVSVTDPDTHTPLTARVIVHGVDGTLDPTFGPDFRASGAGPLIDTLRGSVTTPVPAGRYRVAATKGLEWSIDAKTVDVAPGDRVRVALAPRHVVPTPGVVGGDLHVHARPSFDSPVSVEDRVLSLVAAGVDFAVPTEHNIVGDYGPALAVQGLAGELASVGGVELTTYSPGFGHFGLFPYPAGQALPPFRGSSAGRLITAARAGDSSRVLQINHPRLPDHIGYFELAGFREGGPVPASLRTDFDAIEVYNGYDLASPARVGAVMADWFALLKAGRRLVATGSSDSHRIQYQWAGYPRTMIAVGERGAGDDGAPIDPLRVVSALKKGQATVTSGPVITLDIGGVTPGGSLGGHGGVLRGHVVVHAAPWVDVSTVEVLVGGVVVQTYQVASRPMTLGPEPGSLVEACARAVRLDVPLTIEPGPPSWVIVIARGTRPLDEVLPFMPVSPLAFTNPIWLSDR